MTSEMTDNPKLTQLLGRVNREGRGQDFIEALYEDVFEAPCEEGIPAADVWELFSAPPEKQITAAETALGLR